MKYVDSNGLLYFWNKLKNTFVKAEDLSSVATSGSYNDLSNKPSIPTVPTNVSSFTNDAGYLTSHQDISGKANSADLATVATSGSYNDLSNKPTIPTVPSSVSSFTNDAGYVTSSDIDTAVSTAISSLGSVLQFKGTKSSQSAITGLTSASVGDVWINSADNTEYVCITAVSGTANANAWEKLGPTVDLSGYVQSSDLTAVTNAEIDTIMGVSNS